MQKNDQRIFYIIIIKGFSIIRFKISSSMNFLLSLCLIEKSKFSTANRSISNFNNEKNKKKTCDILFYIYIFSCMKKKQIFKLPIHNRKKINVMQNCSCHLKFFSILKKKMRYVSFSITQYTQLKRIISLNFRLIWVVVHFNELSLLVLTFLCADRFLLNYVLILTYVTKIP